MEWKNPNYFINIYFRWMCAIFENSEMQIVGKVNHWLNNMEIQYDNYEKIEHVLRLIFLLWSFKSFPTLSKYEISIKSIPVSFHFIKVIVVMSISKTRWCFKRVQHLSSYIGKPHISRTNYIPPRSRHVLICLAE